MANKLQIRRGAFAGLPTLDSGEPAVTTDTGQVYVGGVTGNIELKTAPPSADRTIYVATTALGGQTVATQGATGLELASGTATGTTANKLVDSAASFTAALVNKTLYNKTDDTWAKVTAVDSPTQLTLSADVMASGELYAIASAVDNIPEAFLRLPDGYVSNITLRISPGTFANDVTFVGKNAGGNFSLSVRGSTTGTTTLSGKVDIRQRLALRNLTFTNKIRDFFGADVSWYTCVTSGASKLYVYPGSANYFEGSTITFGNDPGSYIAVSSTITKGYTMYAASSALGGNDAIADGLQMYSGTATSTTANKLVDSAANFGTDVVGKTLYNSTDDTWAKVTARDSATQLSLSADIMASGESYIISNAFSTIQKAVDAVPGTVNCDTTLKVSGEIYREDVDIWGKAFSGAYSISFYGTRSILTSGTATSGANPVGNGSAGYGTLTDTTKAWTVDAYQNKFVEITGGTGAGQIRAIHSNTATGITIVGRWDTVPGNTSTYKVVQLDTRVTGADAGAETTPVRKYCIKVANGQKDIRLYHLKMDYAGLSAEYQGGVIVDGGQCTVYYCHIEGCKNWGAQYYNAGTGAFYHVVFSNNDTVAGGNLQVQSNSYVQFVRGCRLTGGHFSLSGSSGGKVFNCYETYVATANAYNIFADMGGIVMIDGYTEVDAASSHNCYGENQATLFCNAVYGAWTTTVIKNAGGWGVYMAVGAAGRYTPNITYSGNVSGTYTPTTGLAAGNN